MNPVRSVVAAIAAIVTLLGLSLAPADAAPSAPASAPAATPGLATIVALRAAHHPGYDRVVLEFDSAKVPTSAVRYVRRLVHDGSGRVVSVPGKAILQIEVRDARAHDDKGRSTVRLNRTFGLPVVLATRSAGDFEGVVTLGVGLTRKAVFQVTQLRKPARLVVDVATRGVLPASSCLYLVKDLQYHGRMYVGSFIVGRLVGGRFTGTTGAFYSEYVSVRGTATATRTRLEILGETGAWTAWPQQWKAKQRTFAGWLPVTRAEMRRYSGGGVPVAGQPCA